MKVLVTGGAGFIGRWVVKKLLSRGYDVFVLDDLSNGSPDNLAEFKGNKLFKGLAVGSVVDRKIVHDMFANGIDLCIHLAAQINVQESIDSPEKSYSANILGTYNILEEARPKNVKVVLMGTCMVYDVADVKHPISEAHPVKPKSPYAGSKIAAESLAESYYHAFGLPVVILRPFNTYGPFQKSNMEGGVVGIFIKAHLEGKDLQIFGDGTQTRDLLYVEDCADFVVAAAENEKAVGHVINAGLGTDIAIKDLAKLICGDNKRIRHIAHHHPQAEIPKLVCNYDKAEQLLGWRPKVSLEEGVRRTSEWIEERLKLSEISRGGAAPLMQKKKMLITGATGLLGPFLLERFSKEYSVTGVYVGEAPHSVNELILVDLVDEQAVKELIRDFQPDIILHAAAITDLELCENKRELAVKVNVGSTENIVRACEAEGISPLLIYISTDYIFDGNKEAGGKYAEDDLPSPINVYSETKHLAEKVVMSSGLPHLIVRTTFFGWSRTSGRSTFSEWIIKNLREKRPVNLTTDQFSSMMLIEDFVDTLAELVENNSTGIFNVASSESASRYEFALRLARVFGLDTDLIKPVSHNELSRMLPSKIRRPNNVSLDVSKIEAHLGRKMPDLINSLEKLRKLEPLQ